MTVYIPIRYSKTDGIMRTGYARSKSYPELARYKVLLGIKPVQLLNREVVY